MREIKFKAYGKEDKIIAHFSLSDDYYAIREDMDRYHIVQYTGLRDMNDKEIYEGDLVKMPVDKWEGRVCEVIFENGGFYLKVPEWNYNSPMAAWLTMKEKGYDYPCYLEVVGNIYEENRQS